MYRARLDSVITVVDVDATWTRLHEDKSNEGSSGLTGAALRQLQWADVVLLNKTDLVPEDM